MNKFERVQFLKKHGLNVVSYRLVKNKVEFHKLLEELGEDSRINIRTFMEKAESYGRPMYLKLNKEKAFAQGLKLLDFGFTLMLGMVDNNACDPKDCIISGTCLKKKDTYILEVTLGPGTVRRVTHGVKIDQKFIIPRGIPHTNEIIDQVITNAEDFPLENIILEWGYYFTQVGYKGENLIFFDFTKLQEEEK